MIQTTGQQVGPTLVSKFVQNFVSKGRFFGAFLFVFLVVGACSRQPEIQGASKSLDAVAKTTFSLMSGNDSQKLMTQMVNAQEYAGIVHPELPVGKRGFEAADIWEMHHMNMEKRSRRAVAEVRPDLKYTGYRIDGPVEEYKKFRLHRNLTILASPRGVTEAPAIELALAGAVLEYNNTFKLYSLRSN